MPRQTVKTLPSKITRNRLVLLEVIGAIGTTPTAAMKCLLNLLPSIW